MAVVFTFTFVVGCANEVSSSKPSIFVLVFNLREGGFVRVRYRSNEVLERDLNIARLIRMYCPKVKLKRKDRIQHADKSDANFHLIV